MATGCNTQGMNTTEIASLARTLLNDHGYGHIPLEWSRAKTILGQAVFRRNGGIATPKLLKLSRPLLTKVDKAEVRDTILHEIAHFVAGIDAGHGPAWKRACRQVGANPQRTADVGDEVISKVATYVSTCDHCGHRYYHSRRLSKRYIHGCDDGQRGTMSPSRPNRKGAR